MLGQAVSSLSSGVSWTDAAYMFFKYDENLIVKVRLRGYNSTRVVRVTDLSEDLSACKVLDAVIHIQFMEHGYHDQFLAADSTGTHFH